MKNAAACGYNKDLSSSTYGGLWIEICIDTYYNLFSSNIFHSV